MVHYGSKESCFLHVKSSMGILLKSEKKFSIGKNSFIKKRLLQEQRTRSSLKNYKKKLFKKKKTVESQFVKPHAQD